jgi:polyhydroxybutyrate depolymerase
MKTWLKVLISIGALLLAGVTWLAVDLYIAWRQPALSGQIARTELAIAQPASAGTSTARTLTRTLSYYVPAAVSQAPALVFVLHGSDGTGAMMRKLSHFQFDLEADRRGFIVVYPDGYKKYWNDCRKSADYASNVQNIDDPAFFRAMIAFFVAQFHADATRVYALGTSNGGHMVFRLALEMPDTFAALAAASANLPLESNLDCRPSGRPASIAVLNGSNDPLNPYNGGLVTLFGNSSRGVVRSTAQTMQYWAALAGATAPPVVQRLPELDGNPRTWIDRSTWNGRDGVQVRLYSLQGSGHVLPSRTNSVLEALVGGAAADLESAPELLEFFSAHRLSARAP